MSALDLDKRKVFSILERRAKLIEDSDKSKKTREIKLCLDRDLYQDGVALLKNESSLEDILLFIEEQTNRRFVYKIGAKIQVVDSYSETKFDKKGKQVTFTDVEINDTVYTILFNPKIEAIHPKTLIDRTELFYITFDDGTFYFNGLPLELTKTANYYKAFHILYSLVPDGGEALFANLANETRKTIRYFKNRDDSEIIKYLQDNLTAKKNGFQRKANLPETLDGGKLLLENIRGRGIQFNNEK